MTRIGRFALAAAVAASFPAVFAGTSRGQTIDGVQGDITVPLLSDVPAGLNGALTIRRYSSTDLSVCCEQAGYANERPDATVNLINNPAAWSNIPANDTVTRPVLNMSDTGANGHFVPDDGPPNSPNGADINNWASYTRGTLRIPTGGDYTFGFNSDDSFVVAFPVAGGGSRPWTSVAGQDAGGVNGTKLIGFRTNTAASFTTNGALTFPIGRGANDSFGTINLPAGDHPFVIIHEDGNGGGNAEFMAAPGVKTAFDNDFRLVGGPPTPAINGRNKVMTVGAFQYAEFDNPGGGSGAEAVTRILNSGRSVVGGGAPTDGTTLRNQSTQTTIRFHDPEGSNTGSHGADAQPFPGDTAGDQNDFGAYARAPLTIAAGDAGRYTFAMFTDDPGRFRITNSAGTPVALVGTTIGDQFDSDNNGSNDQFGTNGCCFDEIGHYDLTVGTYTIEAAFHEFGGGAGFFLYGTQGDRITFDPAAFQLLGTNQDLGAWTVPGGGGGLQLVPEPGTFGVLAVGALGLLARRRRRA